MTRIYCDIRYGRTTNEKGIPVDSVTVECGKCGHEVTSYGGDGSSVNRCLALLNEECPENENNYYEVK